LTPMSGLLLGLRMKLCRRAAPRSKVRLKQCPDHPVAFRLGEMRVTVLVAFRWMDNRRRPSNISLNGRGSGLAISHFSKKIPNAAYRCRKANNSANARYAPPRSYCPKWSFLRACDTTFKHGVAFDGGRAGRFVFHRTPAACLNQTVLLPNG
jgi:hypothetical protein